MAQFVILNVRFKMYYLVLSTNLSAGIYNEISSEFKVKRNMFFCIKYLFDNVLFRENQ